MKASATTIDITPSFETDLGAGTKGSAPWSVDDSLEANFLVLFPDDGDPVVFATFDLLYVGPEIEQAVVDNLPGIPRENILIAASHTHAAPMTDPTKPLLGRVDNIYLNDVKLKVTSALKSLMRVEPQTEVALESSTGHADHSVNRRLKKRIHIGRKVTVNSVVLAPNSAGPRDEALTILKVVSSEGTPVSVVWNYACHPVSFPHSNTVSAHFPGVAREAIRKHFEANVPVLFFQGFSGDTRPNGSTEVTTFKHRVRRWLSGPSFGEFSELGYRRWTTSLIEVLMGTLAETKPLKPGEPRAKRIETPPERFVHGWDQPVSFQTLRLGASFGLLGTSAEVVADFSEPSRRALRCENTMLVGCLDSPFGYAPTTEMLQQGGYEAAGFTRYFTLGPLDEKIGENMLEGLRTAAAES